MPIVQAWGMTETSPLASVARLGADAPDDEDERFRLRATQGRVVPLVDFTIDEESGGELLVRGPWVASAYYEDDSQTEKFEDGWLRTGDVAELTDGAFIKLVDRTKDLVKSGGEWISSVELENVVMGHPKVMEAAVIAVPDEQWGERPCACVVPCEGEDLDADELHVVPRRARREVVDPGADRVHRRGAEDVGRQVRQEGPAPAPRRGGGLRQRVVTASHAPALRHDTGAIERLVADLVAIDSVNPDLVPGGAGEAEIAAFIAGVAARGRARGRRRRRRRRGPPRRASSASPRGRGGGRSLLLCAHTDTVGVEGMTDPHVPRVADGRLYGRGAFDMKGGLAACLLAGAAAAGAGFAGDVARGRRERRGVRERRLPLGRRARSRGAADAAIVTEPTALARLRRAQGLRLGDDRGPRPRRARLATRPRRRRDRPHGRRAGRGRGPRPPPRATASPTRYSAAARCTPR